MNILLVAPYTPELYPFAEETYKKQEQCYWTADEINYSDDIKDWNEKLTESEKFFVMQVLRLFTQADVDVAAGYCDKFIPLFKNNEIRKALILNTRMEFIHQEAYARIFKTLGMSASDFNVFMEYEAMRNKHDYFSRFNTDDKFEIALSLALYGAFAEGLQLFASFAMLLNFQRFNKMRSMCQVVAYSIRDEKIHLDFLIGLFHIFIRENSDFFTPEVLTRLYTAIENACIDVIQMEDAFIDLSFNNCEIASLTAYDVKSYIRFIGSIRLRDLGCKNVPYSDYISKNPLPWISEIVSGTEHTNFFDGKPTAYTKSATKGEWIDVFS